MSASTFQTQYPREAKAAEDYVASVGYGGSAEALAIANAFIAGILNEGASTEEKLVAAFQAGLDANVARREEILAILRS
jgi:hypothetical protein